MSKSMHYCRFRNALTDLRDIEGYMAETHNLTSLSDAEREAYDKMVDLIKSLAEEYF